MNQQKLHLNQIAILLLFLSVLFPGQSQSLLNLSEQTLLGNLDSASANTANTGGALMTPKRRGAPKGNKNALGNRGNRSIGELRSKAREGKPRGGAPQGNTNAQKERISLLQDLAAQYKGNPEVDQWLAQLRQDEAAMQLLNEPVEPAWRGEQLEDFMIDIGAQQRWLTNLRHV